MTIEDLEVRIERLEAGTHPSAALLADVRSLRDQLDALRDEVQALRARVGMRTAELELTALDG